MDTELTLIVVACMELAFAAAKEARDTVASPDIGIAGEERIGEEEYCEDTGDDKSSPAAMRRTPSLRAAFAVGRSAETPEWDGAFAKGDE